MRILFLLLTVIINCYAQCPPCTNQTPNVTEPLPEDSLPYRVTLELADFILPAGLHSFAYAVYQGEWLFIAGRTNGLHDVNNTDPTENSFPPSAQNTLVYVVNPTTGKSYFRSLYDPSSHLSQAQIDLLSVSNPLFHQTKNKKVLYLVGGYGIDTLTNTMGTKSTLTAIDVPNLIKWVKKPTGSKSALKCMRFTSHPILQLTGGVMLQADEHQPHLLAFGQNFDGNYTTASNGTYSRQIRPIQIIDDGKTLFVHPHKQPEPNPNYRRRDLNVVPIIKEQENTYITSYTALSGVFTPPDIDDTPGAWTVPIEINRDGSSKMLDPNDPNTLAQAMNNYSCPTLGLYSQKAKKMYTLLFGGISVSTISDGSNCNTDPNPQNNCCTAWVPASGNVFSTCCNLPFTNDITTIQIDENGTYTQHLMSEKYPIIHPSQLPPTCPGFPAPPSNTQYWFGANAVFIPNENLPTYPNEVIALDKLKKVPTCVGYIAGGIASTILDTNCDTDTTSSYYVFKVTISPR